MRESGLGSSLEGLWNRALFLVRMYRSLVLGIRYYDLDDGFLSLHRLIFCALTCSVVVRSITIFADGDQLRLLLLDDSAEPKVSQYKLRFLKHVSTQFQ